MGKTSRWAGAVVLTVLAAGLVACGVDSVDIDGRTLQIHHDAVVIHARRGPGARIRRDGSLLVGDKVVALTAAQRVLSRRYYAEVEDIRRQGIVMGEAGAAMATGVVGSLFSALFHDDAHIINRTADAQSGRIQADAAALCRQMDALKTTQDALAAAQPAFVPYAIIRQRDVGHCRVTARSRTGASPAAHG